MAKSKKIVMTGGGTAGHVTPNIALMPALQEAGYEITYIGSYHYSFPAGNHGMSDFSSNGRYSGFYG